METKVNRFLFQYRITPHTTTGRTPAELLMNRELKSRLDLMRSDVSRTVTVQQERQKQHHDINSRQKKFSLQDPVYVRNYGRGSKRIPARIIDKSGPVSYTVISEGGKYTRRYQDQILNRKSTRMNEPNENPKELEEEGNQEPNQEAEPKRPPEEYSDQSNQPNPCSSELNGTVEIEDYGRSPVRNRIPPNYYGYS